MTRIKYCVNREKKAQSFCGKTSATCSLEVLLRPALLEIFTATPKRSIIMVFLTVASHTIPASYFDPHEIDGSQSVILFYMFDRVQHSLMRRNDLQSLLPSRIFSPLIFVLYAF